MSTPAELVDAKYLAQRTGRTPRYWQRMASERKIAFAKQPRGEGTSWYFDLDGFEAWLNSGGRIKGKWQRSIGETELLGRGSSTKEKRSGAPLIQRIKELLTTD